MRSVTSQSSEIRLGRGSAVRATGSRHLMIVLVMIAVLSVIVGLWMEIFGGPSRRTTSYGPDSFSMSSLGHRGWIDILRRRGFQVHISQYDSGTKAGDAALLLLLEPTIPSSKCWQSEELDNMIWTAGKIVLVLPKWGGWPQANKPGWIQTALILPKYTIQWVLKPLGLDCDIVRLEGDSQTIHWYATKSPEVDAEDSAAFLNLVIDRPQLILSEELTPLVQCSQGILVGETYTDAGRVIVVSDPDLIANHGIQRGDNVVLASRIIDILHDPNETIIVDESLHGHSNPANVWRAMLRFPLVLVLIHVGLFSGFLVLATVTRFGSPVPVAASLQPGKQFLIDNTAELLRFGGHSTLSLKRYLMRTLQDVLQRLNGPANLDPEGRIDWLQRASEARGVEIQLRVLHGEVNRMTWSPGRSETQIVTLARRIHRWKREMLHESG